VIHPVLIAGLMLQIISAQGAQHMQAGVEAHKQGHFDTAIAEFRQATQTDPGFGQAFFNLGEEYYNVRDFTAAIAPLKRALELNPDLEAAHRELGYSLLTLGESAEAIPHLEKVKAREALGIAQIDTGRYQEAIANLSAALGDHPNDADLLYYLGRAAGLLSKQSIDSLVELQPNSSRAHQAMGESYFVVRQLPQAEKEFSEALRLRPETPGLHLALGLVYVGKAEWAKAEEQFLAETKLQPGSAEAAYRLGSTLLQEGKAHEARLALEQANHLKSDMPETLYSLGKAAALDGDAPMAEKSWRRLLEVEKEGSLAAQTHFALAALYRKLGDSTKAEDEMREFRKLQKAQ
jgi:tetratricopeptide (TPR) repeat protein